MVVVAMYGEGLRVYPDFDFAHYNLAELLYRAGEKHQAKSLQHLERAYDLMATDDPKRFLTGPKRLAALRSCIARLGKIYSSQGKLEKESVRIFRVSISMEQLCCCSCLIDGKDDSVVLIRVDVE